MHLEATLVTAPSATLDLTVNKVNIIELPVMKDVFLRSVVYQHVNMK
jgi:hypothetical protein